MTFEEIIKLNQAALFKALVTKYHGKSIGIEGSFILVEGNAPIMLVAHLDTVHVESVKTICTSEDGEILMSPEGIGGDDRCGVYALNKIYDTANKKPYLLFTCDEEIGGVGADQFCLAHQQNKLPPAVDNLKLIIEIDRKGENDAVYYDCYNEEFESYITSKGFKTAFGSFSDISYIAPELNVAAVNLSSGYYNPHTQHEYINLRHLKRTTKRVLEVVTEIDNLPKYEYLTANFNPSFKTFYSLIDTAEKPNDLPQKYADEYKALQEYYSTEELNSYRQEYGDSFIRELYEIEFGAAGNYCTDDYDILDEK